MEPAYNKHDIEILRREMKEYGQIVSALNVNFKTFQNSVEASACAVCTLMIVICLGSVMFSHVRFV